MTRALGGITLCPRLASRRQFIFHRGASMQEPPPSAELRLRFSFSLAYLSMLLSQDWLPMRLSLVGSRLPSVQPADIHQSLPCTSATAVVRWPWSPSLRGRIGPERNVSSSLYSRCSSDNLVQELFLLGRSSPQLLFVLKAP